MRRSARGICASAVLLPLTCSPQCLAMRSCRCSCQLSRSVGEMGLSRHHTPSAAWALSHLLCPSVCRVGVGQTQLSTNGEAQWREREAAVLAVGAVAEGCITGLLPALPQVSPAEERVSQRP